MQRLIGVVAIEVALHRSASAPDQTGALHDVAGAPGGPAVLWAAEAASFALGLWLLVAGVLVRNPDAKGRWSRRLREWGRAVVYLAIGVEALRVALGGDASSSRASRRGSADLLSVPGGSVVLAVLGGIVLVSGLVVAWLGIARRFLKVVHVPHGAWGTAFVVLGQVGYLARGVAAAVVGLLFRIAAGVFSVLRAKQARLDD